MQDRKRLSIKLSHSSSDSQEASAPTTSETARSMFPENVNFKRGIDYALTIFHLITNVTDDLGNSDVKMVLRIEVSLQLISIEHLLPLMGEQH